MWYYWYSGWSKLAEAKWRVLLGLSFTTGRDEAPFLMCIARTEGLTLLLIVDGRFDFQYSDGNPANICAEFPCNFHFFLEEHKLELKYSCNFLARSKSSYAIGDSKGWEVALILTASAAPRKRPGGNIDRLIGLVPQLWGDKGTKNSERDTRWSPFHGWVLNQRSNKSFGLGSFGKSLPLILGTS